eukprot:Colp12_sorted_trinity150504_noHs@33030
MGACLGTPEFESKVEKELEQERLLDQLRMKILLLGAGESGKSTVIKQIRMVHKINFTPEEIENFAINLRRNTLSSMQTLIEACETLGPNFETEEDKELVAKVKAIEESEDWHLPPEAADVITKLWNSAPIQAVLDKRDQFWCLDNLDYYFENVHRFVEDDFVPDETDCVLARVLTTGIVTTEVKVEDMTYQIIDVGGQRNERRKWMHCFDNVNAIVYVVNLSGYATVLYEDHSINRMKESLELFEKTLNTDMFKNTPIFLLLNKKDLFESMLKKKPLTTVFPDFKGDSQNVIEAIDYVGEEYRKRLTDRSRLHVYPVAARAKKDVKEVWEAISAQMAKWAAKNVEGARKGLSKMQKEEAKNAEAKNSDASLA